MRIRRSVTISAAAFAVAAAVAVPATAYATHHSSVPRPSATPVLFPSTLNHHTVHKGTKMVLKGHNALHNTQYDCVLTVLKGKTHHYIGPISFVTSSSTGKVTCKKTFKPYKAYKLGDASVFHKCPLTKKDKRHHYRCAIDLSTPDQASATNQYFTAK